MTASEIVALLEEKFGDRVKSRNMDVADPYIVVDAADLLEVCQFLRNDDRLHFDLLNCISGVDYLETNPKKVAKAGFDPHVEVVYHLSSFKHKHRFVLKVLLPRWKNDTHLEQGEPLSSSPEDPKAQKGSSGLDDNGGPPLAPRELPEVPSVTSLWRTADWHEREVYDLSGVHFTGHPELTRILLADDWVGHPLRKDYEYPLEYHGIRGR